MSKVQKLRKENVKFQNLAEHVTLAELDFKSKTVAERNRVLAKERELIEKESELAKKQALLDEETQRTEQRCVSLYLKEKELEDRTKALNLEKLDFARYVIEEKKEIVRLTDEANEELTALGEMLSLAERDLTANIDRAHSSYEALDAVISTNIEEQEEFKSMTELEAERYRALCEMSTQEENKYLELVKRVTDEEKKFNNVYGSSEKLITNLELQRKEADKRDRDLRIHAARLRALYKKHFNKDIRI